MSLTHWLKSAGASLLATLVMLTGCDDQRIKELEEGVSTEQDVRARFGEPEQVWPEADGSRTLEYNRQPAGHRNYMITIGTDGKMSALRQVLAPHNFEKVQPGMTQEQIRRMLGKPARQMRYELRHETEWEWNWIDPPTTEMQFIVTFGPDGLVRRSASAEKLRDGP
ncbi:outer membrane protein assembly factor BamE domain-containing protein [Diaphorobacter sp.]|uniref:outer membrane protein assembly factor BamE domain-containing protein n=1 Tax=Diaphorobacter sp. TaxID=1934310 RepID=UPI003D0BE674